MTDDRRSALDKILNLESLNEPQPPRIAPGIEIETPSGERLRAIGNRVWIVPRDMTFPDMILDLLYWTMNPEWFVGERQKPAADRHQVVHWFDAFDAWREKSAAAAGEIFVASATGDVKALLMLAYDVLASAYGSTTERADAATSRFPCLSGCAL